MIAFPDTTPPVLVNVLSKANLHYGSCMFTVSIPFNSPKRLVNLDLFVPVGVYQRLLSLNRNLTMMHAKVYFQILRSCAFGEIVVHCDFHQGLLPMVPIAVATVARVWCHFSFLLILLLLLLFLFLGQIVIILVHDVLKLFLFLCLFFLGFFLSFDLLSLLVSNLRNFSSTGIAWDRNPFRLFWRLLLWYFIRIWNWSKTLLCPLLIFNLPLFRFVILSCFFPSPFVALNRRPFSSQSPFG